MPGRDGVDKQGYRGGETITGPRAGNELSTKLNRLSEIEDLPLDLLDSTMRNTENLLYI